MRYKEIKIETTEGAVEHITALLENLGVYGSIVNAKSTVLDILNKKEGYEWDYVNPEVFVDEKITEDSLAELIFYLDEDDEATLESIYESLDKLKSSEEDMNFGSLKTSTSKVEDEDWIEVYKNNLKPVYIGKDIAIIPTWWKEVDEAAEIKIYMDPGMAFGTGDHPTTSMCAEFLREETCKDKDILDVGTGSGILAILGEKLKGRKILAVDIDPASVEVARENIKINNCKNIEVLEGDLTKGINFQADIVVGNLMAEVVCLLAQSVRKHMKENSIFISSGILVEKEAMVKSCLIKEGFNIEEIKIRDEWCAIKARKV